MKDSQREALVLDFVRRLKDAGSWCGETHIQKSTYFLQELMAVPLGFNFIFYKHGPFSGSSGRSVLSYGFLFSVAGKDWSACGTNTPIPSRGTEKRNP